MVSDITLAEDVVTKIADVHDLRMLHDVFVHSDGGDPEENTSNDHGDETRYPSKDRQRPGLSHDGKTHLITTEEPSSLLPAHGAELDVMLVVLGDESGESVDGTGAIGVNGIDIDIDVETDVFLVRQCIEVGHGRMRFKE